MTENLPRLTDSSFVWYKLNGHAKEAAKNFMSGDDSKEMYQILGQEFPVVFAEDSGRSAHVPEVYISPYPYEKGEFYMKCPVGGGRKDGQTHFTPSDSTTLDDATADHLATDISLLRATPIVHSTPAYWDNAPNTTLDM